ncbi:MAG: diaminopimelate epimerase [Taibaiella sp.]|nr:diaminopimelate epimerase [Taibaiella sp.]
MKFSKYHGTGNDFILLDNRAGTLILTPKQVAHICHRRFGAGADGLMMLELAPGFDFRMVYFNADGNESSMCGNGGRCITAFARELGLIGDSANFIAIDGPHHGNINNDGTISLQMKDVTELNIYDTHTVTDTGSPHYIRFTADVESEDIYNEGRKVRYSQEFAPAGINVNFVQLTEDNSLKVRTYERGVEDETLSCGTGVTAAAIAATGRTTGIFLTRISTPGGLLSVSFTKKQALSAINVVLTGPAVKVFDGNFEDI